MLLWLALPLPTRQHAARPPPFACLAPFGDLPSLTPLLSAVTNPWRSALPPTDGKIPAPAANAGVSRNANPPKHDVSGGLLGFLFAPAIPSAPRASTAALCAPRRCRGRRNLQYAGNSARLSPVNSARTGAQPLLRRRALPLTARPNYSTQLGGPTSLTHCFFFRPLHHPPPLIASSRHRSPILLLCTPRPCAHIDHHGRRN